jgi:acetyl-CoA synthetase
MYTSGTTAQPKGCQHSTGGYLAYVAGTSRYYQDIHPEDTYWCFADIGWITGHSYIVYGPLALGTTSVMYEGVPTYPDAGRPWRIAERLGVNIFHTAPTTIRMLRKLGPEEPKKYNYHFKHMTTVGEPIEPDVWRWYHEVVGKGEAVIVDTWWQTENGGFLGSTLPALQPMKPGSCGPGVLGIYPVIYDEEGTSWRPGAAEPATSASATPGPASSRRSGGSPSGSFRSITRSTAETRRARTGATGPTSPATERSRPPDGYFRILGRVDDVINVAGHRLGTKELESATITVREIAEAAAVPVVDELRGQAVEMYVSLKPGYTPSPEIEEKVTKAIENEIGKIARPKNVWIVPDMPKTRSGKIMRRVIAAISNFSDVGDTTTLANPEIVEDVRHHVQGEKGCSGRGPPGALGGGDQGAQGVRPSRVAAERVRGPTREEERDGGEMTRQYIAGELSLILGELQTVATSRATARAAARLRHEAETAPFTALASVAVRGLELTDRACWDSLAGGEIGAFDREAAICTELWRFGVCAGLLEERPSVVSDTGSDT